MPRRRFVLLDRDGTLIRERGHLADPDGVELFPGAAAALRALRQDGFGIAVVTNQSGVGRGLFSIETLEEIHARMASLLETEGVALDGIYACTHRPEDACSCRKPATGLVERAAIELGFDPRFSFMVGDRETDIELGKRVGATTLLVRTGYGREVERGRLADPDYVADDLAFAAAIIKRKTGIPESPAA